MMLPPLPFMLVMIRAESSGRHYIDLARRPAFVVEQISSNYLGYDIK